MSRPLNLYDTDRVRMSDQQALAELREDIMRAAFRRGQVHLDSGVEQPYYFDKYVIAARPAILRRLGRCLAQRIPSGTDRIAAPTLGAVAIGVAVSLESGLPMAVVRSTPNAGSDRRPVEGGLRRDESVVLVEDVVVTGTRAAQSLDRLRGAGAQVSTVVSVIDCERGADERLSLKGVDYRPLYRFSELARAGDSS